MEWIGWSLDTDALKDTKYIWMDIEKFLSSFVRQNPKGSWDSCLKKVDVCKLAYIWL